MIRFWEKVGRAGVDDCWLWLGTSWAGGYGRFYNGRTSVQAHRFAYELAHGPIARGLHAGHVCDVRMCVNPRHIFLFSLAEKARRMPKMPPEDMRTRILRNSRFVTDTGCWEWTGFIDKNGYGSLMVSGVRTGAHRQAYLHIRGPIPVMLVLDHLCRNRACVNPWHLEIVTHRENHLRGLYGRMENRAPACRNGHEYTSANTLIQGTHRKCRACMRNHSRARRRVS